MCTSDAARCNGTTTILLVLIASMIGVSLFNLIVGTQLFNSYYVNIAVADNAPKYYDPTKNAIQTVEEDVHSGEEITKFLTGELPFPTGCAKNLNGRCRVKFKPGALQQSSAKTLQQCFVDANKYAEHTKRSQKNIVVSISHKHKIIYRNIPKSASSTARHAMMDFLEGEDQQVYHNKMMNLAHNEHYTMISFIREPLTRFFSSYDEAFFRMGPWMGDIKGEIVFDKPKMRNWYHDVKHKLDKYPYLYEGMKEINDFRKMYCPKDVLATGKFLRCNDYDSIDDGRLLKRFERFVNEYDGIKPFDIHLNMQTTNLIYGKTGEPLPITTLYNSSDAEKGWQEVASRVGVTIPDDEMKHGRHQSRRFDVSKVSEVTQRKICQILALDYCCLNFELPKVCSEGVYCSLEQMEGKRMAWKNDDSLNLVIRPWE